ncbi:hypothetical protein M436DRAFT_40399 [Aureobasidium namibiae CBS 147.97]|uniref:Uncharacterized protein n=1 Tax=Aureobasidium namibiae CBS 147.97 TaxID=1043004 RepID=A0A074WXS5_9PEZI|nr:uncharacterized protein M436DRAFT_40399 [Aureobasidium namibiae CBS 147.97]KEQ76309.1 hypothetical protein M436DRAFT_40399 [Aureobasidium namibiae CBS 147.97]
MNLLDLPREIRDHIYTILLTPSANRHTTNDEQTTYTYTHSSLLQTSRQIYHEARHILLEQNTFIKITTPFPESKYHVAEDGVAIVTADDHAMDFTEHALEVKIGLPAMEVEREDTFVIHVDSLEKFCESWYYSAADTPDLNEHLTLELTLRDPFAVSALDATSPTPQTMKKSLQKRLLLPFGRVKNLKSVDLSGTPGADAEVVAEMKRLMAIPLGTPTERLVLANTHKDAGNAALMANQPLEALEHYRKAWEALFIIIKGKHRKVHGERFFEYTLSHPFEGQYGSMVRIVLRVRLVANSLLAYINLKDWDTAVHIGMRTISIMRQGQEHLEPEQEAANGWISGPEMGKIYYRTAVAFKEMDDKYEARRLLKVAVLFLPNDARVREMIRECALRLG